MMFLGPNELQVICSEEKPTEQKVEMMTDVLRVLLKIPKCSYYTKLAFSENLFSITHGVDDIMKMKNLPKTNSIIVRNLTYCLHGIRLVNRVYNGIVTMKQEAIRHDNDTHIALLESLWVNMKPNVTRNADSKSIFSPDWMLLGFQGKDPTTDFRSLGLLGLYQLVYFSLHRTTTAHMVLDQMSTTGNYYPFAVIGINISQFVMELFHEYRLHRKIFENFRDITMACSNLVRDTLSDDTNCINYCTETIHDTYCLIFEEFFMLWVVRHPQDIMSFSDLFNELKVDIRNRYPVP